MHVKGPTRVLESRSERAGIMFVVATPMSHRPAELTRRFPAHALVVALGIATAGPAAGVNAPELLPVSFEALRGYVDGSAGTALTERGIEIPVQGNAYVVVPFAAQELELELTADGPVLLTWAAGREESQFRPRGPPWRYTVVPLNHTTLRLDMRSANGWTPRSKPILLFNGSGTVVVKAMRVRSLSNDAEEMRHAYDRAHLLGAESIGHTTINALTPSLWSASQGVWLADVVAGAALLVFVAALVIAWLRGARFAPAAALAAAALFATAAWNIHTLVRFLPMANLRLNLDVEVRIRENYYFDPEFGALAALARATIAPGERVGVLSTPHDWFGPQTLCFNLAPRPCAIVRPGEAEHSGISGAGRLRSHEVDVIVSMGGATLPDDFEPVAAASPRAIVARRR